MAKRLVRAKAKIRHAAIPYRVPPGHLLPERTGAVLGVIYLSSTRATPPPRAPTSMRARPVRRGDRLARLLVELMPDEPEALGLLALMLLHDSRRAARVNDAGDLVPLEDQDRARWDARRDRRGAPRARRRAARRRARALPGPGGHRRVPRDAAQRRGHRLGRDRRALRTASRAIDALAGGRAQPRGRRRDGRGPRRRASRSSTPRQRRARSPATTCWPRPAPTSCAGSAATARPPTPTERAGGLARTDAERRFLRRRGDAARSVADESA